VVPGTRKANAGDAPGEYSIQVSTSGKTSQAIVLFEVGR
jgi:hypothetical protein